MVYGERRELAIFIQNLDDDVWNSSLPTDVLKMAEANDEQRTSVSVTWATELVEVREFCADEEDKEDEEDEEDFTPEELNRLIALSNSLNYLPEEDSRNLPYSELVKRAEVNEQRAQLRRCPAKAGYFEEKLASVRKEIDSLKEKIFLPKLVRQNAVRDQ